MNDDGLDSGQIEGPTPPVEVDGRDAEWPLLGDEEGLTRMRLATLRSEHQALNAAVAAGVAEPRPDMIQIARLKKKKLALRDEIARLEDLLLPDIIA